MSIDPTYIYILIYIEHYPGFSSVELTRSYAFHIYKYIYIYISSRIFENLPQNAPEYSHRKLAIDVTS